VDTEAGAHGFDQNYFVQQVAGLSQITGDFMLVKPRVIDLGWGALKSAVVNLQDSGFVTPHEAAARRQTLVDQYVSAFRQVEADALDEAKSTLKELAAHISAWVVPDQQRALGKLVDGQRAKLA
jgi:hypothetical protein